MIDVLLLLMTIIWGTNYSIVKRAFLQMDPQAFNAARMMIGSAVFLAVIVAVRRRGPRPGAFGSIEVFRITREEWRRARTGESPSVPEL